MRSGVRIDAAAHTFITTIIFPQNCPPTLFSVFSQNCATIRLYQVAAPQFNFEVWNEMRLRQTPSSFLVFSVAAQQVGEKRQVSEKSCRSPRVITTNTEEINPVWFRYTCTRLYLRIHSHIHVHIYTNVHKHTHTYRQTRLHAHTRTYFLVLLALSLWTLLAIHSKLFLETLITESISFPADFPSLFLCSLFIAKRVCTYMHFRLCTCVYNHRYEFK